VPVLDQMRVWPRLNIVLVPAIACLLALAFSFFVGVVRTVNERWTRQATLFVVICTALTILIMMIQIFMIRHDYLHQYWREYLHALRAGGEAGES